MKIVTWNCNGALRKKTEELDTLAADIYVVQECEDPASSTSTFRSWAGDYLWTGTSRHKGLGVFAKNGHVVRATPWYGSFVQAGVENSSPASMWTTSDLKLFMPFTVNGEYQVLGVWTKADNSEVFSYIGQLWKYLQIHKCQLQKNKTILLGDFNSNRIWDKPDRWWNHSDVVEELAAIGLRSVYHEHTDESQGKESVPTFFLQRNHSKAYHIDYVFASDDILQHGKVAIGQRDQWLSVSDHMPITLTL